jgi:23S rRNA pseudouridine1911/1915/1917 synthase
VGAEVAGWRFDRWLADPARLGSRSRAAEALLHGRVWLDEVEQTLQDAPRRLEGGERVRLWVDRPGSAAVRGPHRSALLDILYEDADVIVLFKPSGLLTVPQPGPSSAPSLADRVRGRESARRRPSLAVHRLDRDTSGVVVFARTRLAQERLKAQFASRTPERVYLALVAGMPSPAEGEWRSWLRWDAQAHLQRPARPRSPGATEAVSHFRVIEPFARAGAALVEVRLTTGRQHQIRVQAWLAGHPLLGERRYRDAQADAPPRIAFERQALHAARLAFDHPATGERLVFERTPPADFAALLERLRRA